MPRASSIRQASDAATPGRRVALLIDFSRWYGRGLLSGIAKYVREHHEWSVQSEEWRWSDPIPAWFRNWKGDGLIAWIETQELASTIQRLNVPAVDVRGSAHTTDLPRVDTDNRATAALAAEHLMERGFRHYAFCGFVGANYSDARSHWFQERVIRAGFACSVYRPPETTRTVQSLELEKRGLLFQEHLAGWLKALPKPVGIMACNDIRGQQVMDICRHLGLIVPEEVAVIGVDNDEIFCELSDPPLSSVELDTLHIGYEAAALLDRMMAGARRPKKTILVPPIGIVTRRSSDVLAMSDRRLAAGARFLRAHAFQAVSMMDVARAAGMSRRAFERQFVAQFGRAPKEEVMRLRLERARDLLANTTWTLNQIAEKTGFRHSEYLHTLFTRKMGITPGAYRKNVKVKAGVRARLSRLPA